MKFALLLSLVLFWFLPSLGQKPLRALEKVYSKAELSAFKERHGSLDLLIYAYDHAISVVHNNGNKELEPYPLVSKTQHFTDLNVQILPYTQYFRTENSGELLAIKSLYQLQLAFANRDKK